MPQADEQKHWRDQSNTIPVVVHLSYDEVAMLDHLAIQVWRQDPHRPDDGVVGGRGAGRARALRELVRGALEAARSDETRWRPAAPLEVMADFWKREVCWRRSGGSPCVAPTPPWKEPRRR